MITAVPAASPSTRPYGLPRAARSLKMPMSVKALLVTLALLGSPPAQALTLTVSKGALNTPIVFYGTYGMAAEGPIPAIEEAFDYEAFFDRLASVKATQRPINGVRVWWNFHWANAHTPFNGLPRNATDTARRGRYDFTLNQAYLDRMEQFIATANARNIAVQLCLFDGVMLETSSDLRWKNSPYNRANNRDQRALSHRSQFFRTSGAVWEINRNQVDALTARLARYPNVIWEVMNEPGTSTTGASSSAVVNFHKAVATRLRDNLTRAGSKALISVNADTAALRSWALKSSNVDIISYHLAENANVATHNFRQYLGRKPVIISNDGHRSCFSNLESNSRASLAAQLARRVFAADGPRSEGRIHLEFLDNGLVAGHIEGAADYDPRVDRLKPEVLNALKGR